MLVGSGICWLALSFAPLLWMTFWLSKTSEWQYHHKPFLSYYLYALFTICAAAVVFATLAIIFAIDDRVK